MSDLDKKETPRAVFLFSGHMIDAPGRANPRFPPNKSDLAAAAIAAQLDQLQAGSADLALCGGACGGDLLFADECLKRGMKLEIRIPFAEPEFISKSVSFAGPEWCALFARVKKHPRTQLFIMPDELGPLPPGVNPYARNNLWQLESALTWGAEKLRFICLWNRQTSDGPGGTEQIYDAVRQYTEEVYVLDTTKLW